MTTALDTNILLDLLASGSPFGEVSADVLARAGRAGSLVVSEIVYAELGAAFRGNRERLDRFLGDLGIELVASDRRVLSEAGRMWRDYRDGGGSRDRIVSDFLIGTHARHQAKELLTRDRGFYRQWFEGLTVEDPSRS